MWAAKVVAAVDAAAADTDAAETTENIKSPQTGVT